MRRVPRAVSDLFFGYAAVVVSMIIVTARGDGGAPIGLGLLWLPFNFRNDANSWQWVFLLLGFTCFPLLALLRSRLRIQLILVATVVTVLGAFALLLSMTDTYFLHVPLLTSLPFWGLFLWYLRELYRPS